MGDLSFDAVIFDLDGVITKTASVHAHAWKKIFDDYLQMREKRDGEPFKEFTHQEDYLQYVDGKPRYNGVKSFLKSRGITLPMGDPTDSAELETVCGIGNKKNQVFHDLVETDGVEVYDSTIAFIHEFKKHDIRIGCASSSKNCEIILKSAGLSHLFEVRIDGVVSVDMGLKGKPEGDIFVTAARKLGASPFRSVVVEDAKSGVQAGRNGGFGLVIGLAREKNASKLMRNGADVVVRDMEFLSLEWVENWFHQKPKLFFDEWEEAEKNTHTPKPRKKGESEIMVSPHHFRTPQSAIITDKKLVFFLNYDGTLTPIVDTPNAVELDPEIKDILEQLSAKHIVSIVSGRDPEEVKRMVGIENIIYAGNHGFDILGERFSMIQNKGKRITPIIHAITIKLKSELKNIPGIVFEEKKFNIAIHYRHIDDKNFDLVRDTIEKTVCEYKSLRLMCGKKVFEILPNVDWGKGSAIRWIMKTKRVTWSKASVFYIGDDVTDEFAFRTIRTRGTAIVVSKADNESAAHYRVHDTNEVKQLLKKVLVCT
jgi:trehalose 6-phosphate phosphatase